jgi:hypothetical protein
MAVLTTFIVYMALGAGLVSIGYWPLFVRWIYLVFSMLGPVFGFAFMALGSQALNNENPLFIAFGVPVFGSLSGTVLTWLVMKFIRSSQKGPELPATEEAEAR